jgi:chromate transporter
MPSLIEVFVEFVKIGIFMFGGGYGGIALLYKELVENKKWISEEEFLRILGIAESTPGPIAINSATWIGYVLGGLPGSIIATMGVVLPAYIVILGTVIALRPYLESYVAKAVFRGINAAVVALILYAFLRLARTALLVKDTLAVDVVSLAVFLLSLVLLIALKTHPIIVIGVAAIIGLAAGLLNK